MVELLLTGDYTAWETGVPCGGAEVAENKGDK
jgi:hypothetical protein